MDRILLFHLSDLHFGSGFYGSPGVPRGLEGHQTKLCELLQHALQKARLRDFQSTSNDKTVYFVGGDLTRIGSDLDFQLVYTYLFSKLSWAEDRHGNGEDLELGLSTGDTYSIPGNHDNWGGVSPRYLPLKLPPAYNGKIFPSFMEVTPWRKSIPSPNGDFILELFGVDSNEGLRNTNTNAFAGGSLSKEELQGVMAGPRIIKDGLLQLLAAAEADEKMDEIPRFRAVGCHHSFGNNGGLATAWPLTPASIANLLKLCRQFKVHAVLTGHAHYFLNWRQNPLNTGWHVWELRCGSTLQREMATPNSPCTQPQPQGFLVHELTLTNGQPSWTVWKYQYGANGTSHWAFYRSPGSQVIP
jgi:Calcineurin-like phosphoesterase